jgi:hypothetical protein
MSLPQATPSRPACPDPLGSLTRLAHQRRHQRLDLGPWLLRGYRESDPDAPRTLQATPIANPSYDTRPLHGEMA